MWATEKEALIFIVYLFTFTVIKGPSKSQLSEIVACDKYFGIIVHCGHLSVMQPIWPSVPHYN